MNTNHAPGFGPTLRAIRTARGLSQADLAADAAMDQKDVSQYERGERTPRLERISRLAAALEVSVGELVERDE